MNSLGLIIGLFTTVIGALMTGYGFGRWHGYQDKAEQLRKMKSLEATNYEQGWTLMNVKSDLTQQLKDKTASADSRRGGAEKLIIEREQLRLANTKLRHVLKDIIAGCAHPEIAIRRVMVDLEPIRKVLREHE
jgi:hypothetical protein